MTTDSSQPLWHLLQVSDSLDLELASALAESTPILAWEPQPSLLPDLTAAGLEPERLVRLSHPSSGDGPGLRLRSLPLAHGFERPPLSWIARPGSAVLERLLRQTPQPELSPLLCTSPFFASVAERWPGPVIYWKGDRTAPSSTASRNEVMRLDRRLCRAATLVCPASERLAGSLIDGAGCEPDKIQIIPGATRASNLLPAAPVAAAELPIAVRGILRPIAGVIGDLADEVDWPLLEELVKVTPWLSWVFVGPASLPIADETARHARAKVMRLPNTTFVGRQPESALAGFARCFDVAVLSGRASEAGSPGLRASSARLYDHLAACRPMLATGVYEQFTRETSLLTFFDTPHEGSRALDALRERSFDDGLLGQRWQASRHATWQNRAQTLLQALAARIPRPVVGEIAA